jgi:hypothetical protein
MNFSGSFRGPRTTEMGRTATTAGESMGYRAVKARSIWQAL